MKIHLLSIAIAISVLGTSAWSAPNDQHTGHHPDGSTSASTSKQVPASKGPSMAKMDAQTQAMRDMHEKMMAAKTPEERGALMAEHMKTMQDGMAMMNQTPTTGGMKSMKGDMAMHHQMMEKRMEMMGASMQMMMDRLPPAPAK